MTYEELIAENKAKDQLINSLQSQNKTQQERINALEFELNQIKKLIYGSKSERYIPDLPPEQLNLFSQTKEEEAAAVEKENNLSDLRRISYERKKKKHPGRNELPKDLPVEEIVIEPQGDLSGMKRIGRDVTETIEHIPGSLKLIRTIRNRYAHVDEKGEEKIIQAPARERPIPKCIAENGLLANIIVSKFIDHLPFYRQIQRFKREYNWDLHKSTINDWFIAVCTLLDPLYDTMVKKLLDSKYIQADESHIKVQDGNKKGSTHRGYQWVYHAPNENIVIFQYRKGRGLQGPKEFLEKYDGWLQSDGYSVYDKIGQRPGIELAGCHVHNRRYYVKAKDTGDNRAAEILKIYQKIYRYEDQCRNMSPNERNEYRIKNIKPLFIQLKTKVEEMAITALPKSPLGKAIRYTIAQWDKLSAVLNDGQLELDNNLIENKIRPLALGRKNYLFAGSHEAAQRIAVIYTFFATCKANDVNPYQWLKHILDVIAEHKVNELDQLIPRKGMFVNDVDL